MTYCHNCANTGRVNDNGEIGPCPDCAPVPKLWVSILVVLALFGLIGAWIWLICKYAI